MSFDLEELEKLLQERRAVNSVWVALSLDDYAELLRLARAAREAGYALAEDDFNSAALAATFASLWHRNQPSTVSS